MGTGRKAMNESSPKAFAGRGAALQSSYAVFPIGYALHKRSMPYANWMEIFED